MARPRQFDPEDVVEHSMRTFWERGYRDTSVEDLVSATGVRPGSLYNAFPGGKHGLFLEALERYSNLVVPEKLGALERPGAGLAELRAYFDGLVDDLTLPEGRIGCLMVNSTVELAAVDSEVGEVVREHMRRLERNAQRALRNAKRRGEVPAEVDPRAKASQLMATGMGLMVVGKTDPGRKALETIVDAAFADLN
jgi:TetR/AcrR family transcriptional repressor of nem operon